MQFWVFYFLIEEVPHDGNMTNSRELVEILKFSDPGLTKNLGGLTMKDDKDPKEENMKNGNDAKVFEEGDLANENGIFNFDELRLSQNFSELVGVKKALLTVPVRKPNRQEFIRVCPGDAWRYQTLVLELKEERETYLVKRALWSELPGDIVPKILYTVINRQNVLSLWPVRLPNEEGRLDQWSQSAHRAAKLAKTQWIKVVANMSLGAYEAFEALGEYSEPIWPDISFEKILRMAFKDKIIENIDHPVLQKLRGLI
jgi:hypothetical protein